MEKEKIKTDIILKDFWRNNERFADLFNTVVFGGKEVIAPELLQEMDTDVSGVLELKGYKETIARTRDIIKKTAYGVDFIVMGIENQMKIHYAMPLRTMIYDALGYLKEYQEITGKVSNGKETQEEFLSKMRKEDRLHPIITIVIYYSEKLWDGPFSLKDMIVEMPEEISKVFSDYKMNLLQIRESDRYYFRNEDVQTVFEISRDIFKENFDKIQQKYKNKAIKSELGLVIGKITNFSEITQSAAGSKEVNMCKALENLKKQSIEQGIEQGIEQEKKDIIIKMLKKDYPIDAIQDITGITAPDIIEIQKTLL